MIKNIKKLVIYGTGKMSQIMHEIFTEENSYEIVAFALDAEYITNDKFLDISVVEFENIVDSYPPDEYNMMALVGHKRMRNRKLMFDKAKSKGYKLINYVSPNANIFNDIEMGENNIIYAGCYLGPFGFMGDNNIIRPNTYIGHDFKIGSHNYISPGCNIGGKSNIGDMCFIGIGSTAIHGMKIANETLMAAGTVLISDSAEYSMYAGSPAKKIREHKEEGISI